MESRHGTELVQGAIYEFHKPNPDQRIQVEIVFMHGLQVNVADLKNAYYKTWRTADGKEVWPEIWLKEKYPNARILSLAYDSSARKTGIAGNMDPYLLGESLLDQMISTRANIGQNDCPVVFVCHSLGGLIAKEIVVRCNSHRANAKHQNLLHNLKAVFFYATPHGGSDLTNSWFSNIADWFPFVKKSSLVDYLKPKGTARIHTHHDFLNAVNKDCKFYVVAEGRESKIFTGVSRWVVDENSARFPGRHKFVKLTDADHMTVCKPQSKNDTGYLKLIDCIDQVIEEYRRRITVDLSVDRPPIGIEGKINEVSKLLERPEVLIVGLFGMGGVGKTTLSKMFYNRKAFKYVRSCYLENVQSKKGRDVQKELLRGLCGRELNKDEHVEKQHLDMIKDCFRTQKVLVVIDNVSSGDYLEELQVIYALKIGSQSKVVVTGRDNAILPMKYLNSGKVVINPVNGIKDPKGSDLKLFLRYAFDGVPRDAKERVSIELVGEAKKIVQLCNGLPLSLAVLGKYLGNSGSGSEYKDLKKWKETWADAYERLQKAENIGGMKIWSSLRISYDHLGDREKKMFLDFACIFSMLKVEKRIVERIWDSSIGVQTLVTKSLLKEQGGHFVMHDQLRDMGRHMLLKETLKQHPIYLVHLPRQEHLSKNHMEFKKLTTESGVPYIASGEKEVGKSLRQYSKLRLLIVTECHTPSLVDDCLSQCFGNLRWLHLKNCSRVLKISIPKHGSFEGLRVLHIFKCDKIVELPKDIDKIFMNLVEIEVKDCRNLLSLPNSIGKLKNLKRLVIALQGLLVVPVSVGELHNVEYLSFEGCKQLTAIEGTQICTQNLMELKLPIMPMTCLRPCPQLRRLDIRNGRGMKEFPQNFFKIDLPKLEVIKWRNDHSTEVVLKNPNGSKLVLKNGREGFIYLVRRHRDCSISQLYAKRS